MSIAGTAVISKGVIIGNNVEIGENVIIKEGCIIGDNVFIGDNTYVDYRVIIRNDVTIGRKSFIGADCIIGEFQVDYIENRCCVSHPLMIGSNANIRSGTIIYGDTSIGDYFNTGHRVTIREKTVIGKNCSIGTLCDIQGDCIIGDYVNMHSNVHVGQKAIVEDFVWIFPYAILTNDPTPPSRPLCGVQIKSFAIVSTGTILLPGVVVESDSLTAAGAVVSKNVEKYSVVGGAPAKKIGDIRNIKNKITGENVYPWRYHFSEKMPWNGMGYEEWELSKE